MIFLVSLGKMIILFPQNMILFFRRKMKDDVSQKKLKKKKINRNNVFCKCSEKMVFQKKLHWNMTFLIPQERMVFLFPENMIFFLRAENEKRYFSKNTQKYNVFCMLVQVTFLFPTNTNLHFCQRSKDDFFPKNTSKDDIFGITEKDDTHHRKHNVGNLCTSMDIFLSVFIYCFPIKET